MDKGMTHNNGTYDSSIFSELLRKVSEIKDYDPRGFPDSIGNYDLWRSALSKRDLSERAVNQIVFLVTKSQARSKRRDTAIWAEVGQNHFEEGVLEELIRAGALSKNGERYKISQDFLFRLEDSGDLRDEGFRTINGY
jgi:hypothetical protein